MTLDLDALGLEGEIRARAPSVEGLQDASDVDLSAVSVPTRQGLFLLVDAGGQ